MDASLCANMPQMCKCANVLGVCEVSVWRGMHMHARRLPAGGVLARLKPWLSELIRREEIKARGVRSSSLEGGGEQAAAATPRRSAQHTHINTSNKGQREQLLHAFVTAGATKLPLATQYLTALLQQGQDKLLLFAHHAHVLDGVTQHLQVRG